MTSRMPIRYTADIRQPGQCRGNLKTWRGVWTLALSREPPDDEEGEDDNAGEDDDNTTAMTGDTESTPCYAVLSYRSGANEILETRYFGTATRIYLCGTADFLHVDWQWRKIGLHYEKVDLGERPEEMGGGLAACEPLSSPDDGGGGVGANGGISSDVLQHDFLIRSRYLMLGETGNAVDSPDNCIRFDIVNGFQTIE